MKPRYLSFGITRQNYSSSSQIYVSSRNLSGTSLIRLSLPFFEIFTNATICLTFPSMRTTSPSFRRRPHLLSYVLMIELLICEYLYFSQKIFYLSLETLLLYDDRHRNTAILTIYRKERLISRVKPLTSIPNHGRYRPLMKRI
jgi:hypothetical protein